MFDVHQVRGVARTEGNPGRNMRPSVVVVGSLNIDLVVKCRERPRPGETVQGMEHRYVPGGKGANQAYAAGQLGGKVSLVGCIGNDPLGTILSESLRGCGVDLSSVTILPDVPTGAAFITLDEKGENGIIVSGGANVKLTPEMVSARSRVIESSHVLLTQLETPLPTVERALEIAFSHGVKTVVNLTPARPIPDDSPIWRSTVLALNELEAEYYTGVPVRSREESFRAGEALLKKVAPSGTSSGTVSGISGNGGVEIALITLGAEGSVAVSRASRKQMDAVHVEVADTTAAGDTYIGAFGVEWLRSGEVETAMAFASHAAALCVSRFGAQTSIPSEREVREFMNSRGRTGRK
jgi:ribokinase